MGRSTMLWAANAAGKARRGMRQGLLFSLVFCAVFLQGTSARAEICIPPGSAVLTTDLGAANVTLMNATLASHAAHAASDGVFARIETWLEETAWFSQIKSMFAKAQALATQVKQTSNHVVDAAGNILSTDPRNWNKVIHGTSEESLAARRYLPPTYAALTQDAENSASRLGMATKKYLDQVTAPVSGGVASVEAEIRQRNVRQAALNRVLSDEAYRQADLRFDKIQKLLDGVARAHDAKDIQDLQSTTQAESVMLRNEKVKLMAINMLQEAQTELDQERKRYAALQSLQGSAAKPSVSTLLSGAIVLWK
jgi:hypothetical protein